MIDIRHSRIILPQSVSLRHDKFHMLAKRRLLSFWGIRSNNAVVCIKEETLDRRPNTFTRERFHFYGTVRVRDTLRGQTTTTMSTTREGKKGADAGYLGRAAPSVSSSLYWQPLGNPPGDARDEEEMQLLRYPGSYFVTARPDIADRSALCAPIGTHYRSEINFPTSISPWAHSKGFAFVFGRWVLRYDASSSI